MRQRRRCDDHRIDIVGFGDRIGTIVRAAPDDGRGLLGGFQTHVGDRDEFGVHVVDKRMGVTRGDATGTDDRKSNLRSHGCDSSMSISK